MFRVKNLVDSFLGHLTVRVKVGQTKRATLDWYRLQLGKLARAAGDFPAAELRAHHLTAVEFSYHFTRALKALYRWGADEDVQLVPRDPFRRLRIPRCGQRQRVLRRDEMTRLYLAASRLLRRFLFVAVHTLARPGEVRTLLWGEVQWDRRLVLRVKFKGRDQRTDGVQVRTIPLDRPTIRLLRNLWERRGRPGPDVPVWLDRNGHPWTANALRCQMRLARRRAGLDPKGAAERVVCYTLRHTGATNAVRAGIKGKQLSDLMGHARSSTTDRYVHLAGDDLVDAVDRLAARRRQPRAG